MAVPVYCYTDLILIMFPGKTECRVHKVVKHSFCQNVFEAYNIVSVIVNNMLVKTFMLLFKQLKKVLGDLQNEATKRVSHLA